MRRLSAVICLFIALSFTSCTSGISGQKPGEIELKSFDIKDSHVRLDLSDSFRIDADISGNDISKMSCYKLNSPRMSEEKITGLFFPGGGYKREDKENESAVFTKDNEKLTVWFKDKDNKDQFECEAVEFALDKGKEYSAVLAQQSHLDYASEAGGEAVELVKAQLDKLPVEYCDFHILKLNSTDMNNSYNAAVKEQQIIKTNNEAYEFSEDEYLDEDFKFNAGDDCYLIAGRTLLKGLPVNEGWYSSYRNSYNIKAAVSSRGIEFLEIINMYSAEEAYNENPVVSAEKAVGSLYKAFDASALEDKVNVSINEISLIYCTDMDRNDPTTKGDIVPVWFINYLVDGADGGEPQEKFCAVYASDGKIMNPEEYLFAYSPETDDSLEEGSVLSDQ